MDNIVTLIQNLGFPIACCIALFLYMNKQEERHQQEVTSLKESVDRNTDVMTRLLDRLERGEH